MLPWPGAGRMFFSPDGGSIVFQDQKDIYLYNIGTGGATPLLRHPADDRPVAWSPDFSRLLFLSDRGGSLGLWSQSVQAGAAAGEPELHRAGIGGIDPVGITRSGALFYYPEGSTQRDVYLAELDLERGVTVSPPRPVESRFSGRSAFPAWSPDGTRLSFLATAEKRVLMIHSPASGVTTEVPLALSGLARPQWQGSNEWLVGYAADLRGRQGFYRVHAESGEWRFLLGPATVDTTFEGAWSRDGRIWYNRFTDMNRGLFRWDLDTGRRQILYAPPSGFDVSLENLRLSQDQTMLAFQIRNRPAGVSRLMVMPAGGGQARILQEVHRPEEFLFGAFEWLPDSRRILAARTTNDVSQLWVAPLDGGEPRRVAFPPMRVNSLRLNSDGRLLAFHSPKFRAELWVFENFLPPARR